MEAVRHSRHWALPRFDNAALFNFILNAASSCPDATDSDRQDHIVGETWLTPFLFPDPGDLPSDQYQQQEYMP